MRYLEFPFRILQLDHLFITIVKKFGLSDRGLYVFFFHTNIVLVEKALYYAMPIHVAIRQLGFVPFRMAGQISHVCVDHHC